MSHASRQNLALLSVNYLKHLQFAKAASSHTSKSYATDLSQFLSPLGISTILYSAEDSGGWSVFGPDRVPLPGLHNLPKTVPPATLLALLQSALEKWRPLSPASRNRKLACVKGFFRWLHEERWLARNLAAEVTMPKVPVRLPHFISVDEVISVLSGLRSRMGSEAERDQALFFLLYGGGLRVSEACALKWSHVELKSGILRIKGKGGKERLVALPDRAVQALKGISKGGSYLFGDQPLSTRKAYQIIRDAGSRAGLLKPLNPHALRHSFATHMLSSGADLRVLQELLGHSSLAATQKYTHLSVDHLARTLETHHPLGLKERK